AALAAGDVATHAHGADALYPLGDEDDQARGEAGLADGVHHADVAAAEFPDVATGEQADDEVGKWHRADQVGDQGCEQIGRRHGEASPLSPSGYQVRRPLARLRATQARRDRRARPARRLFRTMIAARIDDMLTKAIKQPRC